MAAAGRPTGIFRNRIVKALIQAMPEQPIPGTADAVAAAVPIPSKARRAEAALSSSASRYLPLNKKTWLQEADVQRLPPCRVRAGWGREDFVREFL
jgi:hypothetical protein